MIAFTVTILLSGAFLLCGVIFHMRIRSRQPHRVAKRLPHLHDVIFVREDADEDIALLSVE